MEKRVDPVCLVAVEFDCKYGEMEDLDNRRYRWDAFP